MRKIVGAVLFILISLPVLGQGRALPDFTELVEKQGAAVVNISTTQVIRGGRGMQPFPFDEEDPMADFFRRFFPRQPGLSNPPGSTPPREFQNRSLGSGFIVGSDGHVLTNAHVVDGADQIVVRLTDKREYKAKLLGADKRTDVALLKIDATGLPSVKMGDPASLKVGEWVVAIGSPFGFENSVTAGIVSAKGRSLPQENFVPFIQTDVAINPGNSGGPLFNMKGEVVGINSQIYSRSGGFMGISFAIPIDVAMEVQSQLKTNGKVSRGRIGVVIQEVTQDLAESFGLGKVQGAVVNAVERGSPAEKAGLEPGDVILKFGGKPVTNSSDLPRIVGGTKPGTQVSLLVWRKGSTRELSVIIGEIGDEKTQARTGRKSTPPALAANRLGLVLSDLSNEQQKDLRLRGGVLVEEVRESSVRSNLRPGDILLAFIARGVNTEIRNVDHFNKLLAQSERMANLTLLVKRGEVQTFVTIRNRADNKAE